MGGDNAPRVVVEGARLAVERFGVPVVLVGDPDRMGDVGELPTIAASQVVAMDAEPASSVRRLKDSSIVRAVEAVRDGTASAVLSAGNTGAAMAASLLRMGRVRGVSRPAIAVPYPVLGRAPSTVLDCGANADCQPEWLVQFARMGTAYARQRFDIEHPKVAILTIGEEAGKGNTMVRTAVRLLGENDWASRCGAQYIGNVEGGDLMTGVADVVVCDGFTGNVVLKSLEGLYDIFRAAVETALSESSVDEETERALAPVFQHFDAKATGAAMLLGTRGVTMISHGSSTANTIANAIRTADEMSTVGIVDHVRAAVGAADD